jgi:hypothetical protein
VLARREEAVNEVTRRMLLRNSENIVVMEGNGVTRPLGVVHAADIQQLRRRVLEGHAAELPAPNTP